MCMTGRSAGRKPLFYNQQADEGGATGYIVREGVELPAKVPEPATLALFGAGLLAAARLRRKAA